MIRILDVVAQLRAQGLLVEPVATSGDPSISGIADDSRRVQPGDLFCAVRGHVHDGHDFLPEAAEAGAAAALVETPVAGLDLLQIRVTDSRRAAAVAAHVVLGEPGDRLRVIGVTGTDGKTTTTQLVRHLLSKGFATGSLGTLGRIDPAGEREAGELTTPGPVDFCRQLSELRDRGAAWVVAEISSHALAQDRVAGLEFEAAIFTNLARDHLDYHSDAADYRSAKLHLSRLVRPEGALIVNADEPAWSVLLDDPRSLTYGIESPADYRALDLHLTSRGSRWTLQTPDGRREIRFPLLGQFNISNALAAAAAAGFAGLSLDEIQAGLGSSPPIPGRLEVLAGSPLVLRDYAHTPEALRRVLGALRPVVRGRLIVVFGAGGDRDRGKRPLMGRAAAEGADFCIVTSDNPRNEPPEAIIDEIVPGIGSAPYERFADRRAAIARALELADSDDVVLLAGKGHETHQVIGGERKPFDEAVIVAQLRADREGAGR